MKYRVYSIKIFLIIFVALYFIPYTLYSTSAVEEAPPSAEVQAKLDALKQEIASKASKLKTEINTKLQNKALIGNVVEKSTNKIKLQTKNGVKEIRLNEFTEYTSKVTKVNFDENRLAIGNYLAALGDLDDLGVLTAKQLVLLTVPKNQPKLVFSGQISAKSDKLVLKNNKGIILDASASAKISSISATESTQSAKPVISVVVDYDKDTEIKKGSQDITFNQIKTGEGIIVTGILDKQNIVQAEFIYVIPTLASSSAQTRSASPSSQRR